MTTTHASRAASLRATLLVALSACGFGTISILVTLALRSGTPLIDILVGRYALAAALLSAAAFASGTRRVERSGVRVMVLIGGAQALVAWTSLVALQYITAATLSFLFYTYPAWIAIIARIRHSEPFTWPRLAALALSLTGVVVMVGAPSAAALQPRGVVLALASALLYAVYVPVLRDLQRGLSPTATAAYMASGAAVLFLLAKVLSGNRGFAVNPASLRSIVALAVISTTASFLLFLRGLSVLGPVRTGIVSTIEPFCTALLAAWLLGQPLSPVTLLGGGFIAAAVVLLQLRPENSAGRVS